LFISAPMGDAADRARLAAPRAGAALARAVGMLLVGWPAFNLVEGLVDHQLLGNPSRP
jgi:uncharacterized membrane protein